MGRKKKGRSRRINVYISEELLVKFDLLYFDPTRGKAEYGKLSEVLNHLLMQHINEKSQEKEKDTFL